MDKLKYFESEKQKCQKFIDNIYRLIEQLDLQIENLKKSKQKTDNIISKFDIDCYNYNLVDDVISARNRLVSNISEIIKNKKILQNETNYNLDIRIKKISNLNDLLDKSFMQLREINRQDFSEIEKLQMNAIKKEIHDKFWLIKSEIDRDRIKKSFDKIQNKGFLLKAIDIFFEREEVVDRKKENLFFAIHEIDMARAQIMNNKEPKKEYKIIEIMAGIELFFRENDYERKYKKQFYAIKDLIENIIETFSIERSKLKAEIKKMQTSKLPVKIDRKMNQTLKEKQKMIAFLVKNGYYECTFENNIKSNLGNIINKLNIVSKCIENKSYKG